MKLALEAIVNPAAFAKSFQAANPAEPVETALSHCVLRSLESGPATWWRLCDSISCTRYELDQTLTAMLASGQIVRLDHVGGFRYGLPDVSAVPVSTKPEEGKSA